MGLASGIALIVCASLLGALIKHGNAKTDREEENKTNYHK